MDLLKLIEGLETISKKLGSR